MIRTGAGFRYYGFGAVAAGGVAGWAGAIRTVGGTAPGVGAAGGCGRGWRLGGWWSVLLWLTKSTSKISMELGGNRRRCCPWGRRRVATGMEETALAADAHAGEAGEPASDDLVLIDGEGERFRAVLVGGVELGAVDEVTVVAHGVPLVGRGQFAGADLGIDVAEGKGRGGRDVQDRPGARCSSSGET